MLPALSNDVSRAGDWRQQAERCLHWGAAKSWHAAAAACRVEAPAAPAAGRRHGTGGGVLVLVLHVLHVGRVHGVPPARRHAGRQHLLLLLVVPGAAAAAAAATAAAAVNDGSVRAARVVVPPRARRVRLKLPGQQAQRCLHSRSAAVHPDHLFAPGGAGGELCL
jgi:hypothetical protein